MSTREIGPRASGSTPREQRLAAAGRVAAGLLHDVRNQLGTISNLAFVLEKVADDPDKVRDLARRLAGLTQARTRVLDRLRDFVRQDATRFPDGTVADLSLVAREAVALCAGLADSQPALGTLHVECETAGVLRVAGEAGDLRTAAIEMVLNAMEASPPGGTVRVRARRDGAHACLDVHDDGAGLSEGMAEFAVDPFISAKEAPDAGLGLAAAWGIARRHGGDLAIRKGDAGGTIASLSVPVLPEDA